MSRAHVPALVTIFALSTVLFVGLAQARTLRLGHAVNTVSHYQIGAEAMASELSRLSNGSLTIEIFPNRQLGDERALIEGATLGLVDLAVSSTGPLGNFAPDFLALDVPYVFADHQQVDAVLDGPLGQGFLDALADHGLLGLAFWENGFRHLTNSRKPVVVPGDLKGMRLRTMENRVHILAFETLGAIPQALPWGETLAALRQGALTAQENPIAIIYAFKLGQLQRFLSLTGHVYSPAVVICSPATWKSLSENERDWLIRSARHGAKTEKDYVRQEAGRQVMELEAEGMAVNEVDKAAFQQALAPMKKRLQADYPWLGKIEHALKP
ncbi:MAG: DctP family TRAP transporter solute-binding subunit [Deltaproteobacteria bacterium]|nr:DctP family TRAP transporter solute-binding subunit [Deltaproteobacteria bacterium]